MVKESRGVLASEGKELSLTTVDLKQDLADDEVLVNVHSAPVNPSDINFVSGSALVKKLPTFVGFEGSGFVVSSGKGEKASSLLNKRVAIFPSADPDCLGSWGEYTIMKVNLVFPLADGISYEQGACALINPLTAQGLINRVREGGHKALVSGAASSALGKMLIGLCKKYGIRIVCLVRKQEYVKQLLELGADQVLVSTDTDFYDQLAKSIQQFNTTAYLDPVTGTEGAKIVSMLPAGSLTIIYGGLSKEPYVLSPGDILFSQKSVTGFMLNRTLSDETTGPSVIKEGFENILEGTLVTHISKRFELEDYSQAIKYWKENPASDGKVLIYNKNFNHK